MFQHEGLDHIALSVRDVEASARWYGEVLGLEPLYHDIWKGHPLFIGKGKTGIALFPAKTGARSTSPSRDQIAMLHLALRADRKNFLAAQGELKSRGISFEFQDHEISHSIYFRDPDGHQLEITTYDLK